MNKKRILIPLLSILSSASVSLGAIDFSMLKNGALSIEPNTYIKGKTLVRSYWGNSSRSYIDTYYTDDYFIEDSRTYNPSLTVSTLAVAGAAMYYSSSYRGENWYKNFNKYEDFMTNQLGFTNVSYSPDCYIDPTADTIGAVVSRKTVTLDNEEKFTIVNICVRGSGYGQEWANNFFIGDTVNHYGFESSAEKIYKFLNTYVNDLIGSKGVTNIKFWITGYSRAAAVGSMLAVRLNQCIANKETMLYSKTDYKDIFCYTFETPMALAKSNQDKEKYSNIFNFINNYDLVTKVAPESAGFTHPGNVIICDSADPTKSSRMQYYLEKVNRYETYLLDDFRFYKSPYTGIKALLNYQSAVEQSSSYMNLDQFFEKLFAILMEEAGGKEGYVNKYQASIMYILNWVSGDGDINSFINEFGNSTELIIKYIITSLIMNLDDIADRDIEAGLIRIVSEALGRWIKTIAHKQGNATLGYELESCVRSLTDLVVKLITKHVDYVITAVNNASLLAQGHYPDLCLAWALSLCDDYENWEK